MLVLPGLGAAGGLGSGGDVEVVLGIGLSRGCLLEVHRCRVEGTLAIAWVTSDPRKGAPPTHTHTALV